MYGVAVAKALALPPVAAEWCLPLVRPGGAASSGSARAPISSRRPVALRLGGELDSDRDGLLVLRKCDRLRPAFRAGPGVARKRPFD